MCCTWSYQGFSSAEETFLLGVSFSVPGGGQREKGAESIDGLWFTAGDHFPSICKCQLSENMLSLTLQ